MNYYGRAIEILSNPDLDHRALAFRVARDNPSAIVYAVDGIPDAKPKQVVDERPPQLTHDTSDLEQRCIELARNGKKTEAVTLYRNTMGITFSVARRKIDALLMA